jgi:hypothetical protein
LLYGYNLAKKNVENFDEIVLYFLTDGQAPMPKDRAIDNFLKSKALKDKLRFVSVGFGDDFKTDHENEAFFAVMYSITERLAGSIEMVYNKADLLNTFQAISNIVGNPYCVVPSCRKDQV